MRYFFEVSFPFSLPKEALTYHFDIGSDEPVPALGCRVIAPIQRRFCIGYLTRSHTEKPEFKTVPIQRVLDIWPLMSTFLFKLGYWMSRRYLCSQGEAFNAMLPSGIKQKLIRSIEVSPLTRERVKSGQELSSALVWLEGNGNTLLNKFVTIFPAAHGKISQWLDQGLILISHTPTRIAGPKLRQTLVLIPDKKLELENLTPKERLVLEFILQKNYSLTLAEVRKGTGVSQAPVNQLLKKGVLRLESERVMREVGTEAYYDNPAEVVPTPTIEQSGVLSKIRETWENSLQPQLIWGVTCSGKTEIYLRWASEIIDKQKTVIVLVPEISLTPQMTKRFRDRFGDKVAILHSRLSDGERFDQWEQIRQGKTPVVVGARSAVFAPVPNLGAIILDEEGEPSFKQNDVPRYHAREVAEERCKIEKAQLLMGSATPTMDAFHKTQTGEYGLLHLPSRVTDRLPPAVEVVDMRFELVTRKNRSMFSGALEKAVKETLSARDQIILFLNRRGYSSFVLCRMCGKTIECSRCRISLVYHSGSQILRCHYCGEAKPIPKLCPFCQGNAIKFFGAGTQRIEAETRRYFPQARIQRLDSDTTSTSGSLENILERFGNREIDILIGTQMVAKGLDFPGVTLVGIMAADSLLRLPDFRASERNFSLLAQVSGRSGRGAKPGRVVLQTYYPDHHSILHALTEDYSSFFATEAKFRQATYFPPFGHIALILMASENSEKAVKIGENIRAILQTAAPDLWQEILGPAPAPIEKIQNRFRFQVLLKFSDLDRALKVLREHLFHLHPSGARVTIDIDPYFSL